MRLNEVNFKIRVNKTALGESLSLRFMRELFFIALLLSCFQPLSTWAEVLAWPSTLEAQENEALEAQQHSAWLKLIHEPALLKAMALMNTTPGGRASLKLMQQKQIRVMFRNLSVFGKQIAEYDALAWMSSTGEVVLLLNMKHQYAPPEALAALISHEAMHCDGENSKQEEVEAWKREGEVWQALYPLFRQRFMQSSIQNTGNNKREGSNDLLHRLNTLVAKQQMGTLDVFVRQHEAYKDLEDYSPGFEKP